MAFRRFHVVPLAQTSYLLADGDEAAVVDPRRDVDEYVAIARREGWRIRSVLLTHVHADFVAGAAELHDATGAEIVIGERFDGALPCRRLGDGDVLQVGDLRVTVLPTPGHTPESVCYLVVDAADADAPRRLLSGDTLFVGDVGRPDLVNAAGHSPISMARSLWHSVHDVLGRLDDRTQVWPAHGAGSACAAAIGAEATSTIGAQRIANWAFAERDPEEFARRLVAMQRPAPRSFATIAAMNRRGPRLLRELPRPRELVADAVQARRAEGAVVVDLRHPTEHARAHWPDALSLPSLGDLEPWAGALLPTDAALVLHAADASAADDGWTRLLRVGHENVVGWTRALPDSPARRVRIGPAELHDALQTLQVVDVRTPAEFAAGHVPGAVNAELGPDLARDPVLATLDRARPTAVVCNVGYRSAAACRSLEAAGFVQLRDVDGGVDRYVAAGYPIRDSS